MGRRATGFGIVSLSLLAHFIHSNREHLAAAAAVAAATTIPGCRLSLIIVVDNFFLLNWGI